MFVKIKRAVFNCKEGGVYDLDEEFARSFVATGHAEPISASEFMTASRKADDEELRRSILSEVGEEITRALSAFKAGGGGNGNGNDNDGAGLGVNRTDPRPPGGGIEFHQLASGDDEAAQANIRMFERINRDRQRGVYRGLGEVLNMVAIVGRPQLARNPNQIVMANRRLQLLSGVVTEEKFNEATKTWEVRTQFENPDGSLQTVTRTGTDSLVGGTTYGYALKPDFLGNLFEISMEQQVYVNQATRIPVGQANELRWPAWDQYTAPKVVNGLMQPAVFSGVSLYYANEAAPRTLTDAALNTIDFKIVDLTAFTALSRDFIVDNYLAFDAALTRMIGRAFGWMEDWMSIQGNGVGRPQGYFNSNAAIAVSRHAANKISSNDLTSMIAAASPMVWDDLRWITNVTTIPQLAILADNNGTYVFQPNALINQAMMFSIMDKSMGGRGAELMHRPMGSLLGFPVYFSEKVSQLGGTGDLSLVAPSQFGVAERSGLEIAVSEHYYFQNDLIAYRLKKRHDMKMLWRAPYTQADNFSAPGSGTQVSPAVILH